MLKMKQKKLLLALIIAMGVTTTLSGCGKAEEKPATVETTVETKVADEVAFVDNSYIVDAAWLDANKDREDLLILDARGAEVYAKGHIPGSVPVMWQQFSIMEGGPGESPEWGTILKPEELSKAFSAVGISKDKEIVVYAEAQNGWGEEGRIVWMLRRAGLENTKMLDGGFDTWKKSNYETSKDIETIVPSEIAIDSVSGDTNIDTATLNSKLDKVTIIDVRAKSEFDGATKYGEVRGGHLPGAINIEFKEFLNSDGTLKKASEIQSILDEKGIKKDAEIVTYCTAGIRSAHMQIVLDMLGYENAKNYDDSFYAWAGNPELPLEK